MSPHPFTAARWILAAISTGDALAIVGVVIAGLGMLGGLVGWMWHIATVLGELRGIGQAIVDRLSGVEEQTEAHDQRLDDHDRRLDDHGRRLESLEAS